MSTGTQTPTPSDLEFARNNLRMAVERQAFDLGVEHFDAHHSIPSDLGDVAGVLELARTTSRRDRVFRAVGKGIRCAMLEETGI
jgi:hypothetical protein